MPSRRSHNNSHHGCAQCKRRRVKCDETRPVCQRCSRQKSECTYNSIGPPNAGGSAATFAVAPVTQSQWPSPWSPHPQLPLPPPLPPKQAGQQVQDGPPQFVVSQQPPQQPPQQPQPLQDQHDQQQSPEQQQPSPHGAPRAHQQYRPPAEQQQLDHSPQQQQQQHSQPSPNQQAQHAQSKVPKVEQSDTTGPPTPSSSTSTTTGIRISSLLSPPSPARQSSPAGGGASVPGRTEAHRWELRLMHHWAAAAEEIVSSNADTIAVWRDGVVQEALDHEFLLHALFSLSAFHLASRHGSREAAHALFREVAHEHHTLSVAMANSSLGNINEGNCHAMFAMSCLVAMLSFVLPHMPLADPQGGGPKPRDPLRDVVDGFYLWRGTNTVVQSCFAAVAQGPMAGLFYHPDPSLQPASVLPPDASASFRLLTERAKDAGSADGDGGAKRRHLYEDVIAQMCVSYASCLETTRRGGVLLPLQVDSALFGWPILVEEEFMECLREGQPLALAILAHYAAMLHEYRAIWWAAGWGPELFDAVDSRLGPAWDECLRWPREHVRS